MIVAICLLAVSCSADATPNVEVGGAVQSPAGSLDEVEVLAEQPARALITPTPPLAVPPFLVIDPENFLQTLQQLSLIHI